MRLHRMLNLLLVAMLTTVFAPDAEPPSSNRAATASVTPDWTYKGDASGDDVGASVAIAGDVDDDGYDDVIVGASHDTDGVTGEGVVTLFYGSGSGVSDFPDWTFGSGQKGARLGAAVGGARDVDGDGRADVVVGAPEYNNGESKEGAVFLFYGASIVGLTDAPDWAFYGGQADANLGASVSSGDVNGDGYSDLIVGAPGYVEATVAEGAAFVFYGGPDGPADTPDRILLGGGANARFGAAVGAGDVNGDGCDDVVVGAPGFDGVGGAFLYAGSDTTGLRSVASWTASGAQADGEFGSAVAGGGDVNGDGYGDVLVGAPGQGGDLAGAGAAFLFCGGPGGLEATPRWSTSGNQEQEQFGAAVAMAGDVNDDGYDDAAIGAPRFDNDQAIEGGVFLFHGARFGLWPFASWRAEGDKADTRFGSAVGGGGDVNDDGAADLVAGAPLYKVATNNYGAAFGYLGPIPWQGLRTYLPLVER